MGNGLSRRQFLAAGAGAGVALSAGGGLAASLLSAEPAEAASNIQLPPPPPANRSYVSRPDLHPPAVTTSFGGSTSGAPPYIFLAVRQSPNGTYPSSAQPGLMIIDQHGEVVWFKPLTSSSTDPFNFQAQSYGGRRVLTWFQGTLGPGFGTAGTYEMADNTYNTIASFTAHDYPSDLHEYTLTPQGTALVTAYQTQSSGPVIGHAQEIDVASKALVFDWPCYPAVPLSDSYVDPTGGDYFHMNSISLWPGAARNLLISARNTCCVYLVDRATKRIIWRVGGRETSYRRVGSTSYFSYQHDGRSLSDASGFSVFDDNSQPSGVQSWAKVLTLHPDRTITMRRQFNHYTAPVHVPNQGNCQLLANGMHFVGWGAAPYFSLYSAADVTMPPMVLDGRMPAGVESYRAFMSDWNGYPPPSEIGFVVFKQPNGSFVAFASWNGSTFVARWVVYAATSSGPFQPVGTGIHTSFEQRIPFTHSGATEFYAQAYDSSGGLLGQSQTVPAS
jgi:hypothetical protein